MAVITSYPGVYVQEVSSGVRPISAASTSIAAFLGQAEKGPIGEAKKVFSFTEFQRNYGGFLSYSYLAHAVYQFFNNGGTQCYIVRVAGDNTETADIAINDRADPGNEDISITVAANSAGAWGNALALIVESGTNNEDNEFNLGVYIEEDGAFTLVEGYEDLSMVPDTPNYVETRTAASAYIVVTVNDANSNVAAGTSRGRDVPSPLGGTGRTRLRINVDGDGYQEIDLATATGPPNLDTDANIAAAIQELVRALEPQRQSTDDLAFDNFTCTVDGDGFLLLSSGVASFVSSVNVAAASDSETDATGLLNLGPLNGGTETLGAAITRPANTPADSYYLVGDHNAGASDEVDSVTLGSDGDPVMNDQPYKDAFSALDTVDDVSLLAVPGIGSHELVSYGMNYCETTRPLSDCFFIGDMALDDDTIDEAKEFRGFITPKNSYGAVYLPWLKVSDPTGASDEPILVPPSGFVAGMYAKTDARRGVWKAPAGTSAALAGAVGLATHFTDVQQGNLNPVNINVIRQFDAAGIVLWGARTITSDPEWKYVPVRRMAIMLRKSIYDGIQWSVFEPNDEPLWAQLRLNIGTFMNNLFRQGAFQGATPSEAYFVKCDSETTTQADIDLGIVNVLVGFAPLKPAEFVVVQISQMAGQSSS